MGDIVDRAGKAEALRRFAAEAFVVAHGGHRRRRQRPRHARGGRSRGRLQRQACRPRAGRHGCHRPTSMPSCTSSASPARRSRRPTPPTARRPRSSDPLALTPRLAQMARSTSGRPTLHHRRREDRVGKAVVLRRFVRLAGGRRARIVIIPTASSFQDEVVDAYTEVFTRLGAPHLSVVNPQDRADARASTRSPRSSRPLGSSWRSQPAELSQRLTAPCSARPSTGPTAAPSSGAPRQGPRS